MMFKKETEEDTFVCCRLREMVRSAGWFLLNFLHVGRRYVQNPSLSNPAMTITLDSTTAIISITTIVVLLYTR